MKLPKLAAGTGLLLLLAVVATIAWRVYQRKRHASTVEIVPGR